MDIDVEHSDAFYGNYLEQLIYSRLSRIHIVII